MANSWDYVMPQKHSTKLICEKCNKFVPESQTIESFYYERLIELTYHLMTGSSTDHELFASLTRRSSKLLRLDDSSFAEMFGVSLSTITRWKTGESFPHISIRRPIFNKLSDMTLRAAQENRLMHRYTKTENLYKNPPGVIGYCPIERTVLCGTVREATPEEYFILHTLKSNG